MTIGMGGQAALLGITGAGQATTTALQAAQLSQMFNFQEQNTVLSMAMTQLQNAQYQLSMIAQNIASIFQLQQQMQQTFFKTTKQIAQGWIQALGGGGGG